MAKENEDGAEKTEEPTAKKLEKAASEGQVVRSPEVTMATCTILGFLTLLLAGSYFAEALTEVFKGAFIFDSNSRQTGILAAPRRFRRLLGNPLTERVP